MSVSSIINLVSKDKTTFFDFLENVWSFATICFGLLLAKASKYCNIQKKNNELSTEKTESQESLCLLLAKLHSIRTGRHLL